MFLDDLQFKVYVTEMQDGGSYIKHKQDHELYKEKINEFNCNYEGCEFYANSQQEILNHKGSTHFQKFKCTHEGCVKEYFRKSDLKRHQNFHTIAKCYKCQLCNKRFNSSYNVKRHEIKCSKNN